MKILLGVDTVREEGISMKVKGKGEGPQGFEPLCVVPDRNRSRGPGRDGMRSPGPLVCTVKDRIGVRGQESYCHAWSWAVLVQRCHGPHCHVWSWTALPCMVTDRIGMHGH